MGYTLDQLLDATGVSNISGRNLTKKASAKDGYNLSKLAERCRRAVDATPDEHNAANERELVEKTAAVAIIGRTLAEIRDIEGASPGATKTAAQSSGPDQAQFVKAALEAGHTPQQIAEFLEKTGGILSRISGKVGAMRASRGYSGATKAIAKGEKSIEKNVSHWNELIRKAKSGSPAEKSALLAKMRRTMPDSEVAAVFEGVGGKHGFNALEDFKSLPKAAPKGVGGAPANPYSASMNLGGSTVGITPEQMQKMKKPALYLGAGYMGSKALSRRDEPKKSGRGPVIITG